jgi:hypothetical protein
LNELSKPRSSPERDVAGTILVDYFFACSSDNCVEITPVERLVRSPIGFNVF